MSNDLNEKTVSELKEMCRENDLPVTGIKSDLIQRLTEHLSKQENPSPEQQSRGLNQHDSTDNPMMNLRFSDIKSAFKKFKGDRKSNVKKWIEHFEEQATIFQLTEMQKFVFAKCVMEDQAKLFLEYESKAKTWAAMKNKLTEEYGTELNAAAIHQQLTKKQKKTNSDAESISKNPGGIVGY